MLKGWILATQADQKKLEEFGVVVGPYNPDEGCFEECQVSDEALDKLDPLWGQYYWGLTK